VNDLADLLAEAGTVVAGSAALFGTMGFVAAQLSRDLGIHDAEPVRWAERGTLWGGVFGLAAWSYRAAGLD
jgi:hypothetical protein